MRFLILLFLCARCFASDWYVSRAVAPNAGSGATNNPWSLQSAITNATIQAGDTVWLREGVYTSSVPVITSGDASWKPSISGATNNLVTFRSYPGEWAKIDRQWRFGTTKYLRFRELEFYDSFRGRNPTNISFPNGPWVQFDDSNSTAPGYEWINCVFHDVDDLWDGLSAGATVRGCIIWNVGIVGGEYVTSPGILSGTNNFSGNIVAWTAAEVMHGNPAGQIANSNIIFGSGAPFGGVQGATDFNVSGSVYITNNCTYGKFASAVGAQSLTLSGGPGYFVGNTFVGESPIIASSVGAVSFLSNTVFMNQTAGGNNPVVNSRDQTGTWTANGNSYFAASPYIVRFYWGNSLIYTLSQWQSNLGLDSNSTGTDGGHPPDAVYVFANQDVSKRAHVAVYNWTLADNVTVNLSGVLASGDHYALYSAQNYGAGPIRSGTFAGSTISVPMTNLTTAPILYGTNWGLVQPSPTSPEFGAFVVVGIATPPAWSIITANIDTLQ